MLSQLYYHVHKLIISGLEIITIVGIRWVRSNKFCALVVIGVGLVKLDTKPC